MWKKDFKERALKNNISEDTIDKAMSDARFLPKVIEYDRYQQNFTKIQKHILAKEHLKK